MIEMNFRHMRVFYVVAKHLSYSRAAEELYVSQPAISQQVQELEKAQAALRTLLTSTSPLGTVFIE